MGCIRGLRYDKLCGMLLLWAAADKHWAAVERLFSGAGLGVK